MSISIIAVLTSAFLDLWFVALFPCAAILAYFVCIYPKHAFYLFFGILPFSIEIYFANGLGTDLPTEPLILFFFLYSIFLYANKKSNPKEVDIITFFVLLHLVWISYSSLWAEYPLVSYKFLLAKLWYVLPFYFLSQHFLRTEESISTWIKVFLIGLICSITYVFIRHLTRGLSFDSIGWAVSPFFRNHVNYSTLIVISLPLCWYKIRHSKNTTWYTLLLFFLLIAIYFSYTRAAMIAVVAMIFSLVLIKYRLLFKSMLVSVFITVAGLLYMGHNNNYLHFAPNYESTVAHTRFDNLMEATYKMEDISTMERLHRWVSGFNMILERPWTGFGPNNFYFTYKPYSNYSFKTYVSNNPDRSGIHNYYLMMAVEQGIIGFLVFCSLLILAIFTGERAYHRYKRHKDIIMMSLLMMIGIMVMILINDLVEAVKVGSFMFVALGIISFYSKRAKSNELIH